MTEEQIKNMDESTVDSTPSDINQDTTLQDTTPSSSDAEPTPAVDNAADAGESAEQATPAEPAATTDAPEAAAPAAAPRAAGTRTNTRGRGRAGGRGGQRRMQRREKPEFEQKIVSLRRVTRVMAGGRRFSFSCAIVIGDRDGRVGFGIGKANDTSLAIDKAVRQAKKNMLTIKRTDNKSIPFDSQAKYNASVVLLRPVSGKGLAAGGGVRVVLELAGIDEVGGKLLSRSKNNINNAKATLVALLPFATNAKDINI